MAKFRYHAGRLSGSVGKELTYSSWRGIKYVKIYQVPSNPRTKDQVAIRTVFQHTAHIAKVLYHDILKPYTFPKPQKMTAYNKMIQINQPMFVDKAFEYSKLKIFEGPLPNGGITSAHLQGAGTADERILFEWEFNNTGAPDDKAIGVLYDASTGNVLFTSNPREEESAEIKTRFHLPIDPSTFHCYLVFVRPPAEGTSETGLVSNTAYTNLTVYK
jgi:hypothetical protein